MMAATIPMGVVLAATTLQYRYPPGSGARDGVCTVSGCGPAYADGPTVSAKPTVATPILEEMRFIALPSLSPSPCSRVGPCDPAMTRGDESKGGSQRRAVQPERPQGLDSAAQDTAMSGRAMPGVLSRLGSPSAPPGLGVQRIVGG